MRYFINEIKEGYFGVKEKLERIVLLNKNNL